MKPRTRHGDTPQAEKQSHPLPVSNGMNLDINYEMRLGKYKRKKNFLSK